MCSRRRSAPSCRAVRTTDPLGRPIEARFAIAGRTAVVETAAASGLGLVAPSERDAFAASSAGTGELIVAAVDAGAREVLVGVGGSATTDGGAGAIAAIKRGGGLDGAKLRGAVRRADPVRGRAARVRSAEGRRRAATSAGWSAGSVRSRAGCHATPVACR